MNGSQAYLSAVEHRLDCPRRQKRLLLQKFSDSTLSELDGSYDELCAQLGQPEEVAEALMECVDPEVLDKSKRKKKIILGGLIAALLVACIGLFAYYLHARTILMGDFYISEITEYTSEPVEISDEEFNALVERAKKIRIRKRRFLTLFLNFDSL